MKSQTLSEFYSKSGEAAVTLSDFFAQANQITGDVS